MCRRLGGWLELIGVEYPGDMEIDVMAVEIVQSCRGMPNRGRLLLR